MMDWIYIGTMLALPTLFTALAMIEAFKTDPAPGIDTDE